MGALVAALYAGGMSGKDLRAHALHLLSNRIDFAKYVFSSRQTKIGDLVALKSLQALHLSGEKLVDLAMPNHMPKLIEDFPIPLTLVSTDFERMAESVHRSGSVITAVAASIAIPGVIIGPKIDGRLHVDGGITNPVPFDHVRQGNDIVVAIDVTGRPKALSNGTATNMELAIGSLLIMFHKLAESRRALSPPDLYMSPNVDAFGSADFFRVKEIFTATEPAKDDMKRRLDKMLNATLIGGP